MAVDPRAFREAIGTSDVSYPIPYLVAVVLAFGLALLAFAMAFGGTAGVCLIVAGLTCAAYAFGLVAFTILKKPELLRSERHTEIIRLIEIAGDKDNAPEARSSALGAIRALSTSKNGGSQAGDKETNDA